MFCGISEQEVANINKLHSYSNASRKRVTSVRQICCSRCFDEEVLVINSTLYPESTEHGPEKDLLSHLR